MTEEEIPTARIEVFRRPSPVPVWVSTIVIGLAVFSVGYTFLEQRISDEAFEILRVADEEDDRRVEGLVEDLQVQQERAETERERLRLLVVGILLADSEEERRQLLQNFADETAEANRDNAAEDEADPPGQPSTNNDGVTEEGS